MDPRKQPGQTPLTIHRDPHGVALLYPAWWQAYTMPQSGMLFSPGNLDTFISVDVTPLGTRVVPEDMVELERGFLTALRGMPNSDVLEHRRIDTGPLLGMEAQQRFDGKKRWIRLLYRGELQVRLIAQGATEQEFDFWLPSFEPAMTGYVFDAAAMPLESY